MVAKNEVVHDAIQLNSATGLIGMPQQTIGSGVNVRCLINPNIRVNGLIELNQASVFRTVLGNNDIAMTQGRITDQNNNGNITIEGTTAQPASIATDGVYIVRGIMYTGDTRGQAWYGYDVWRVARWILFPHRRGKEGFNENFLFGVVLGDFNPSNGCNSVWKLCDDR